MLLNNALQNEAIMSNVGEIGEFRIRNSAKAFNILSSGLYANKIRAVIRELSCNAVDSHVAAGKQDTPFDVHLPNQMEPWFSIRDYGIGLTHDQVTSIYTTYFESTKTDSNAYIGALGLGSKSPFSYTDNFTVTAVKNGKKGIYSAFINAEGVPSIALMMSEDTTEPAGVEVKMSVNDQWDYSKFRDEARQVYTYFKLHPIVTGYKDFEFKTLDYETENIVPGVHSYKRAYGCVAVMGNIAYPIDIPNAEKNLGDLRSLLDCGLEMHFDIGELDFQASREGLSYIPQTIDAIKRKLMSITSQLSVHVATEAGAIKNAWERALFLNKKISASLWRGAVEKYITDHKVNLFHENYGSMRLKPFSMVEQVMSKKYNISLRAFTLNHNNVCVNHKAQTNYDVKDKDGKTITRMVMDIEISSHARFVINDTKVGATERAKNHWRNNTKADGTRDRATVYVIEPVDRSKPVKSAEFFKAISFPPTENIFNASMLLEKERKVSTGGTGKNVTIMKLQEKGYGGYYTQREAVWRDAGKADAFDTIETHYYLPLSGYNIDSPTLANIGAKDLLKSLSDCGLSALNVTVYGVRKGDIEFIKTQSNWKPIEDYIKEQLTNITPAKRAELANGVVDRNKLIQYNKQIVSLVDAKSPYAICATAFDTKSVEKLEVNQERLERLARHFQVDLGLAKLKVDIEVETAKVYNRYPLLRSLTHCIDNSAIAEYINLIDNSKGI
jgi:hypothetical protein